MRRFKTYKIDGRFAPSYWLGSDGLQPAWQIFPRFREDDLHAFLALKTICCTGYPVADTLNVELREQTGSLRMKRMRQSGRIPAVLYGHGENTEVLSVSEKELRRAIDHGSHIVELKGAANESALIKDVQWDAFGINLVHLDLARVDANEQVEVTLPIELRGDAQGTHHGGIVNFHQHQLTILCPANKVPEKIELKIGDLDVDQTIDASQISLPEGAELGEAGTTPIVSCALPTETPEMEAVESEGGEPEVIGQKDEEE